MGGTARHAPFSVTLSLLDSEGYNIGPLVQAAAEAHHIPLVGMVALGRAESTWTRTAERYGTRTAEALACLEYGDLEGFEAIVAATMPDVSWGGMQITLDLARSYGIGDGTPASALAVREALFSWETSIEIGADYYQWSLAQARDYDTGWEGDELLLQAMIAYNAGQPHPRGDWYWQDPRWRQNAERYIACLAWAHKHLGG